MKRKGEYERNTTESEKLPYECIYYDLNKDSVMNLGSQDIVIDTIIREDLDGDGLQEIIVCAGISVYPYSVLVFCGKNYEKKAVLVSEEDCLDWLEVFDLNGDGREEILATFVGGNAGYLSGYAFAWEGDTCKEIWSTPEALYAGDLYKEDLDKDGIFELITTEYRTMSANGKMFESPKKVMKVYSWDGEKYSLQDLSEILIESEE